MEMYVNKNRYIGDGHPARVRAGANQHLVHKTQFRSLEAIAELFIEKWNEIFSCMYVPMEQKEDEGSYHSKKRLAAIAGTDRD